MSKARGGALAIGWVFGVINVISYIGETWEHRDHAWQDFGPSEAVLVVAGPLTFILASLAGLKSQRVAGYWLIGAGFLSTALFSVRLANYPSTLLVAMLIWIVPLFLAGWLWLKSVGEFGSRPQIPSASS